MKAYVILAFSAAVAALTQPAQAALLTGSFAVTVHEGATNGAGFSTTNGNPFSGANTASATFTYTGPISFSNTSPYVQTPPGPLGDLNTTFGFSSSNISNYSGSGTVSVNNMTVADFSSLTAFLNSSGSSGFFQYGSYYTFDLGTVLAGTAMTITHDDGAALYQGNTRLGTTVAGPTSAQTDVVSVGTTGDTILRYSRQNSSPSILTVDAVGPVPEVATWAMMLGGFGMVGGAIRRRKAVAILA